MKFFSLIQGDEVTLSRQQKVIPADAFSTLLEADELLKVVQEDALAYREQVTQECETLKKQAAQEGFQQGLAQWTEQIQALEKEIAEVSVKLQSVILPVALQAAQKVVGREMTLNPETIADIVATNLKAVAGHRRVTIYCNKDDLANVRTKKPQLMQLFEQLESLAVEERGDIQQGGCIIETESGIINAQPDQVWSRLEAVFEKILRQP